MNVHERPIVTEENKTAVRAGSTGTMSATCSSGV
jgi:hypothetical protein